MITEQEKQRFASKVEKLSNGCHRWLGALDRDGYGTFHFRRRARRAHRFAYFMAYGPIAPGMVVNHKCRNPWCVNPQHLELLTTRENALQDSNSVAAINARKTHCPKGHEYDKAYTAPSGSTQRICSICEREKHRLLKRKQRAENDPFAGQV